MPEPFRNETGHPGSPSAAVVDRGALRQLQEQLGEAGLTQLVAAFLERTPDRLILLRAAAVEGDAAKLREQAHSLKGTARSFGAAEMGELAARIERLATAGSLEDVNALVAELGGSFERTRAEIGCQAGPADGEDRAAPGIDADGPRSIRVLLADDDAVVRALFTTLLAADPAFELVGAAADADRAIELAAAARPDVALLDLDMPGGEGRRAIEEIRDRCPETQPIALTALDTAGDELQRMRSGAVDFLSKGASEQEILTAVRNAVRREVTAPGGPRRPARAGRTMESRIAALELRVASLEQSLARVQPRRDA